MFSFEPSAQVSAASDASRPQYGDQACFRASNRPQNSREHSARALIPGASAAITVIPEEAAGQFPGCYCEGGWSYRRLLQMEVTQTPNGQLHGLHLVLRHWPLAPEQGAGAYGLCYRKGVCVWSWSEASAWLTDLADCTSLTLMARQRHQLGSDCARIAKDVLPQKKSSAILGTCCSNMPHATGP